MDYETETGVPSVFRPLGYFALFVVASVTAVFVIQNWHRPTRDRNVEQLVPVHDLRPEKSLLVR